MKKIGIACVLACLSSASLAEGLYVAGDVGTAKWKVESGSSKTDAAISVAIGYTFDLAFSDTVGIELGYRDFGGLSRSDDDRKMNLDLKAVQLSLLAGHKINESLSFYGRVGVADMQLDGKYKDDSGSGSASLSKDRVLLGVGGQYAVAPQASVYIEYNRYQDFKDLGEVGDLRVASLVIGFRYHF